MTQPSDLRIGIWVDDARISKYDRDLIEWARSQPGIVVAALLVSASLVAGKRPSMLARSFFRGLTAIESTLLQRSPKHREHLSRFDARALLANTPTQIVAASDVNQIASLKIDLIVFVGADIPGGGFEISTTFGTVAFEWADPIHRRGAPVAFWEVFERQDTTDFALKIFSEGHTTGDVLLRGHVPTRHYYLLNEAALYEKGYHYLRTMIASTASSGKLPVLAPATPTSRKPSALPSALQSCSYLARFFSAMVSKRLSKLAGRELVWNVAFVRDSWRQAALWRGRPIDNPPGRYLADPFVVARDGREYCFVEDFDCAQERAHISVYELGATEAKRLGVVIDEPFHLSFPYLFEYQGALFMCPESCANRDIRIYRCVDFPMKWELEKVAMSGVGTGDTMIFERQGKWWLFTTMDPGHTGELATELFVFSASSPFDDAWQPHARNPVLIDATRGRNAGLLVDGGKIFRVSQRRGFDRYGKSLQINEIINLTDEIYEERCIEVIEPTFQDGVLATHHLHSRDGVTVFDFLAEASARPFSTT